MMPYHRLYYSIYKRQKQNKQANSKTVPENSGVALINTFSKIADYNINVGKQVSIYQQ